MLLPAAIALFSCLHAPSEDAPPPKAMDVKYQTMDGVIVAADYFAPRVKDKKAPVAILIHMFPVDRKSWAPLLNPLLDGGFAVLAYDIRGRGGSIEPQQKELRSRYGVQDPSLFQEAWQDAEGAKRWMQSRSECDTKRIVVIGASVGASIAIDYAKRDPDVKAVVGLSPYMKTMGLDSGETIKAIQDLPILFLAPQREYNRVQDLVATAGGKPRSEMLLGGAPQHGTNMFDEPNHLKTIELIMDFLKPFSPSSSDKAPAAEKGKPAPTDKAAPPPPAPKK